MIVPSVNTPNKRAQLQSRTPVERSDEWKEYHEKGIANVLYLGLLHGKIEQTPVPDDLLKDEPVLTKENFECNGWEVQEDSLEPTNALDIAYLSLLGMPTESEPGCRQIVHRDADRKLWDDPQTPNLYYENVYCPDNGGILAQRNYKTYEAHGKKYTATMSWADAVVSAWFTECEDAGEPVDSLRWVRQKDVVNEVTVRLIDEMQQFVTFKTRTVNEVRFKVYTLTRDDDDFFALFASPNGNGIYYMLRDHMRALKKFVQTIYVIYNWEEDGDNDIYGWSDPHMVLKF